MVPERAIETGGMTQDFREPELSPAARRVLAALLLSLALHAVLLGWVGAGNRQAANRPTASTLQVRLVPGGTGVKQEGSVPPVPVARSEHQRIAVLPKPVVSLSKTPLPVLNTPVLLDTHYYLARELDVLPVPVHPIIPALPQGVPANQRGWVRLRVRLDDMGTVRSVRVEDSSPPEVFDQAARDAFVRGAFRPGIKDGRPVYSELEIKVFFQ